MVLLIIFLIFIKYRFIKYIYIFFYFFKNVTSIFSICYAIMERFGPGSGISDDVHFNFYESILKLLHSRSIKISLEAVKFGIFFSSYFFLTYLLFFLLSFIFLYIILLTTTLFWCCLCFSNHISISIFISYIHKFCLLQERGCLPKN